MGAFMRFFSALLLTLMTWMHSWASNWGVAIILTTLLLKIAFLPLTLSASRSAKRMQKIQPEMKVIREKFKDSPEKQQAATMALFKQHKVNPVGSCLPMLVTLPFFWAFFRMLSSVAELRFSPFLWAHDLSAPDTVGYVFGFPINILALLLGLTMYLQMHFTPAGERGQLPGDDDEVHPADLHGVLLHLPLRPGALLLDQRACSRSASR